MKVLAVFVAALAVAAAAPLHSWSLQELELAINDPATPAHLLPHIIDAMDAYMDALWHGMPIDSIQVVTPAGLLPSPSESFVPVAPVIQPETVAPEVVAPEVVAPAPAAAQSGSPLVQIVVNVNGNSANPIAVGPAVQPEQIEHVIPTPVNVAEESFVKPTPVAVAEGPQVIPTPVIIVEEPQVKPIPVTIVEQPEAQPTPVAVVEQPEYNPIDNFVPGPAVNPIDILAPLPAVIPVGAVEGILV